MSNTKFTWNETNTNSLIEAVAGVSFVSQDMLKELSESLETTTRSVGSKLRSLIKVGKISLEIQKAAEANKSAWSAEEEAELVAFLEANSGTMTYNEISVAFMAEKFTSKQVQGKVLSLEMTDLVKKAEKPAAKRTYTEEEEASFVNMAAQGDSLEAIAEAMSRPLQSVRGKALSLLREGKIAEIPEQAQSNAQARTDFLEGVDVANLTVEEIAEQVGKSQRGIKNTLTRRAMTCKDYDGAKRFEKLEAKKAKTA